MQKLTSGTYESAVSMLSEALKQSENNAVEQNGAVLKNTAEYLTLLSMFVNTSMVEITTAVSKLNEQNLTETIITSIQLAMYVYSIGG